MCTEHQNLHNFDKAGKCLCSCRILCRADGKSHLKDVINGESFELEKSNEQAFEARWSFRGRCGMWNIQLR
jgi:hypothetical protein